MPKIFVARATNTTLDLLRMQQTAISTSPSIIDLTTLLSRQAANPGLILVEALPKQYFVSGHLPGALHLPHDSSDAVIRSVLPDAHDEIVTYCASRTCSNSHILARRLAALGYQHVAIFGDGKVRWQEEGLTLHT
jgi:rhodanese-related sulfurtransferase